MHVHLVRWQLSLLLKDVYDWVCYSFTLLLFSFGRNIASCSPQTVTCSLLDLTPTEIIFPQCCHFFEFFDNHMFMDTCETLFEILIASSTNLILRLIPIKFIKMRLALLFVTGTATSVFIRAVTRLEIGNSCDLFFSLAGRLYQSCVCISP